MENKTSLASNESIEQVDISLEKVPSIWKNKSYIYLWIVNILSTFGYQLYAITIPLLIYDISKSALAMSTMRAIEFFPNIFIGIIAGVIVDRFSRKLLLSSSQLVQFICLGLIIYLLMVNQLELWHLYILGFVLTSASYTFGNCQHAVLPNIVTKSQLTDANAKITLVGTTMNLIGPGIGGLIITLYSFEISLSVILVCCLLVILLVQLIQIPSVRQKSPKNSSFINDIKEGITSILENKTLLTPTIIVIFSNFAASLIIGVLVYFAVNDLGTNEKEVGLMFSIAAIGGILGSIAIPYLRKRIGRGRIYLWCLVLELLSAFLLIFSFSWWFISICVMLRFLAITMSNVVYFTIRQEFTPNHLLGRVAGTTSTIMKLSAPIGFFIAGLWAEFFPVVGLFIISTIILSLLCIILSRHHFVHLD